MFGNSPQAEDRIGQRRLLPLLALCFGMMFVLVLRLFQLQVLHGRDYFMISELTRLNKVVMEAPRGSILDRNGAVLAESVWGYKIPTLGIPEGLNHVPIALGGALIVLFAVEHIIALFRGEAVVPSWH